MPAAGAELAGAVAGARAAALAVAIEALLRAPPAPHVAFDLAERRAEARHLRRDDLAGRCAPALGSLAATLPVDDALLEEARERFAVLAAGEEDPDLGLQLRLLEETAALLEAFAARAARTPLRSLARRLRARAGDLGLARRLHGVLGRRGTRWLENTSFLLLGVVFLLLLVDAFAPIDDRTRRALLLIDGAICLGFVAEFLFKLALAPARRSWFLRNVLIDLVPALPAAVLLLDVGLGGGEAAVGIRALRFLRVAWFARYVQAMRPVLQFVRLLLFLVRGFDELVRRFAPLLDRSFVFFEREPGALQSPAPLSSPQRRLLFQALHREHLLLDDLPPAERNALAAERARRLAARIRPELPCRRTPPSGEREVAVEAAIVRLHALAPEDVALWLSRRDVTALDRVIRVMSAPVVRRLPIIRRLAIEPMPEAPEQRIVALARRVARLLERWRDRMLYVADLHGILTGPQILDRIASAMVAATQRPAIRLLIFGALFLLVSLIVGRSSGIGSFLHRFVELPLLVLGGICFVLLLLGRWLRRIAGEATDSLRRTSEAHFQSLVELRKQRHEATDLAFLARRVFRGAAGDRVLGGLRRRIAALRGPRGAARDGDESVAHGAMLDRVALLYLHYLDGALLHEGDVTTSHQLLANLSLENIRTVWLRAGAAERRRLHRLALDAGRLRSGPFLWFQFIAESIATETAKRLLEYNRHCLTLDQRARATPAEVAEFERWLAERLGRDFGRTLTPVASTAGRFRTTDFTALDFLAVDPEREARIARLYGPQVRQALRHDRTAMVREIFGMRPLDRLPRSQRTVNFYRLHRSHLAGGRMLFLPLRLLGMFLRWVGLGLQRLVRIVQEILTPRLAAANAVRGRAPFAVAMRKIHRMKGANLLETMRMRVAFDPEYCGAAACWSEPETGAGTPELERDMDFLGMLEHEREELRAAAARTRDRVVEGHALFATLPSLGAPADPAQRPFAETAATIAWLTDLDDLRTLLRARGWAAEIAASVARDDDEWSAQPFRALLRWLGRGLRRHPARAWLRAHPQAGIRSWRGKRRLCRAYDLDRFETRRYVDAWSALPPGADPEAIGFARLRAAYADPAPAARELTALRAVQSLSVLDVRNYRELVFELGDYAADGEDRALAAALP